MTAPLDMQPASPGADENAASQPPKPDISLVESAEAKGPSSYADAVAARLSKPHRDYLLERHGTLDLDPIPSMDPADPYNWPTWKVSDSFHSLPRTIQRLTRRLETHQSSACGVPRLHGHFHRSWHYPRVQDYFGRVWGFHAAGELLDLVADCNPGWCALVLEAVVQPLWPTPNLPSFPDLQSGLQCGMCEEP